MPRTNKKIVTLSSLIRKVGFEQNQARIRLVELQNDMDQLKKIIEKIESEIKKIKNENMGNGYLIQKRIKYTSILHENLEISINRVDFIEKEISNLYNKIGNFKYRENLLLDKVKQLQALQTTISLQN
jgi:predicted  nucleic acid-binding Zn-ribbon protein